MIDEDDRGGGDQQASLIETERYLLTCMRYIELNPVCAGMVGHPPEYPFPVIGTRHGERPMSC